MTIRYKVIQNNTGIGKSKYFAIPSIDTTMDMEELAKHMSEHNTPFSKGAIMGVLTDMVQCIHEMVLEGKRVRLDNLAVFSVGLKNKGGTETAEEFSNNNISGLKLRARAIAEFTSSELKKSARLRKVTLGSTGSTTDDDEVDFEGGDGTGSDTDNTGGSGTSGTDTSGSDTGGSGSQTSGSDTGSDDGGDGFQG